MVMFVTKRIVLCGTSFFHEISDFCHFFLLRAISQVYLHSGYFNAS